MSTLAGWLGGGGPARLVASWPFWSGSWPFRSGSLCRLPLKPPPRVRGTEKPVRARSRQTGPSANADFEELGEKECALGGVTGGVSALGAIVCRACCSSRRSDKEVKVSALLIGGAAALLSAPPPRSVSRSSRSRPWYTMCSCIELTSIRLVTLAPLAALASKIRELASSDTARARFALRLAAFATAVTALYVSLATLAAAAAAVKASHASMYEAGVSAMAASAFMLATAKVCDAI
mmetsp:Transcript_6734/g.15643  ORF Transcript_6734/g.15643 Transcript_6734/m.15643 type:complete len:236 (-) Transcript_6734:1123-1830(-)